MYLINRDVLTGSVKKSIIDYYYTLTSKIDVAAQEILIKQNDKLSDAEKKELNETYICLIDKIEMLSNLSMCDINKYFDNLDKLNSLFTNENELNKFFEDDETIDSTAKQNAEKTSLEQPAELLNNSIDESKIKLFGIKQHCLFIHKSDINPNLSIANKSPLGLFISFDWYPNENQLNQIKSIFEKPNANLVNKYEFDEYCLNFKLGLDKFLSEESNLKSKNIYEIKKQDLTKIESLKIDLKCYEARNILKFDPDVFKNLLKLQSIEISSTKQNYKYCDGMKFFLNDGFDLNSDTNLIQAVNKLSNLKVLKLRKCSIKNLSESFHYNSPFYFLNNLEELDLSSNKIDTICRRTFEGLFDLKKLDMSYNKLKEIKYGPFAYLENLTTLDLSGNPLLELNWHSFGRDLKNLQNIYFYDCKFSFIQYNTFRYLENLKEISFPACFSLKKYQNHMEKYGLKSNVNKIFFKPINYKNNDENDNNNNYNNFELYFYHHFEAMYRYMDYDDYEDDYEHEYEEYYESDHEYENSDMESSSENDSSVYEIDQDENSSSDEENSEMSDSSNTSSVIEIDMTSNEENESDDDSIVKLD